MVSSSANLACGRSLSIRPNRCFEIPDRGMRQSGNRLASSICLSFPLRLAPRAAWICPTIKGSVVTSEHNVPSEQSERVHRSCAIIAVIAISVVNAGSTWRQRQTCTARSILRANLRLATAFRIILTGDPPERRLRFPPPSLPPSVERYR